MMGRALPTVPGPAPGILCGERSVSKLGSCSGGFFFFLYWHRLGAVEPAVVSRSLGSEEGGRAGAEPRPAGASPSHPCSPFPPSPLLLRSICRVQHLREHLRAAGKHRAKNPAGE